MEKTEFIYQRWFLRVLCSAMMLPFIILIQLLLVELSGIEDANFWINLILVIICFLGFGLYYKYTQNCKWFLRKGSYWVEDGIVYIQTNKKTYELKNVKCLMGTTVSAYGYAKSGMLKIDIGKRTITLASPSIRKIKSFSDSELLPLFETVLEYNTELKKSDVLEFCYEIEK